MEIIESAITGADPKVLFDLVADLANYPDWLALVARADPDTHQSDTWIVELRGHIGPLTRAKRLRMVRTVVREDSFVRFERIEVDERDHAPWIMDATVEPCPQGAKLTMRLVYDGNRFAQVIAPLLRDEVRLGRAELAERFPIAP